MTERVPDRSSALGSALEAGGEASSAPIEGCVCGTGLICPSGSAAFAFGMMDHLSLKSWAAIGLTARLFPNHLARAKTPHPSNINRIARRMTRPGQIRVISGPTGLSGSRFLTRAIVAIAIRCRSSLARRPTNGCLPHAVIRLAGNKGASKCGKSPSPYIIRGKEGLPYLSAVITPTGAVAAVA